MDYVYECYLCIANWRHDGFTQTFLQNKIIVRLLEKLVNKK